VIVSHGGDDGLHLNLTDKTGDYADNRVLGELSELVDQWPSLNAGMLKAYAEGYSIPEAEVQELVQNCDRIRRHGSICVAVHIRGCKIGAKTENLKTILDLFNALVVSAPECPMLYVPFNPDWSRPAEMDVDVWKTRNKPATRRREFYPPGSGLKRLVLDVDYAGSTSSTRGVVQRADDLAGWAGVVYANQGHGVQRSMPIAAMWPENGYFLPQEQGYIDQINAVRED
jgi:hypothetical protein